MTAPPKRHFYVSIVDGEKRGLLAGPYDTHDEALAMVSPVRRMASDANPVQADFAAFGTAGCDQVFKTVFGKVTPDSVVQSASGEGRVAERQGRLAL